MTEEEKTIRNNFEVLNGILRGSKLYLTTYISGLLEEHNTSNSFWRLAVAEKPGDFTEENIPFMNIWGDPKSSNKELDYSEYSCKATAKSYATIFTLQGYEVFLNEELFTPIPIEYEEYSF